jgi:hypothetical protein
VLVTLEKEKEMKNQRSKGERKDTKPRKRRLKREGINSGGGILQMRFEKNFS